MAGQFHPAADQRTDAGPGAVPSGRSPTQACFAPPEPGTNGAPAADTNLLRSGHHQPGAGDPAISRQPDFSAALSWTAAGATGSGEILPGPATNFSQAEIHLPFSEYQAAALLKLGDACFRLGNYTDAAIHYNQLIQDYATMAGVTNELFDLALYQLVQANDQTGQRGGRPRGGATYSRLVSHQPLRREKPAAHRRRRVEPEDKLRGGAPDFSTAAGKISRHAALGRKSNWPSPALTSRKAIGPTPSTPTPTWRAIPISPATPCRPQVEFSLALACWQRGPGKQRPGADVQFRERIPRRRQRPAGPELDRQLPHESRQLRGRGLRLSEVVQPRSFPTRENWPGKPGSWPAWRRETTRIIPARATSFIWSPMTPTRRPRSWRRPGFSSATRSFNNTSTIRPMATCLSTAIDLPVKSDQFQPHQSHGHPGFGPTGQL